MWLSLKYYCALHAPLHVSLKESLHYLRRRKRGMKTGKAEAPRVAGRNVNAVPVKIVSCDLKQSISDVADSMPSLTSSMIASVDPKSL